MCVIAIAVVLIYEVRMCRAVLFQLSRLYGLTNSQQLLSGRPARELGGGEKMASQDEKAEAQETFNFFDKDRARKTKK